MKDIEMEVTQAEFADLRRRLDACTTVNRQRLTGVYEWFESIGIDYVPYLFRNTNIQVVYKPSSECVRWKETTNAEVPGSEAKEGVPR